MRIIYTAGDDVGRVDSVTLDPDKIFAVIGPFESHMDAPELQEAIEAVCRQWLLKQRASRSIPVVEPQKGSNAADDAAADRYGGLPKLGG